MKGYPSKEACDAVVKRADISTKNHGKLSSNLNSIICGMFRDKKTEQVKYYNENEGRYWIAISAEKEWAAVLRSILDSIESSQFNFYLRIKRVYFIYFEGLSK